MSFVANLDKSLGTAARKPERKDFAQEWQVMEESETDDHSVKETPAVSVFGFQQEKIPGNYSDCVRDVEFHLLKSLAWPSLPAPTQYIKILIYALASPAT